MVAGVEGSRLDLMVARLITQRTCLDRAADLIGALDGWILEVGLGKGRTYDHLRKVLPDREIFAFDRDVHAPKDCVPDADHLILGDLRDTLPAFAERHGQAAVLVHADIGSDRRDADAALIQTLASTMRRVIRPGGMLLSDRDFSAARLLPVPLPDEAGAWPYFMYRAEAGPVSVHTIA